MEVQTDGRTDTSEFQSGDDLKNGTVNITVPLLEVVW